MNSPLINTPPTPRTQNGLALLVALLVLVAMSLAGIALIRSVDTASLIAGNIAFRQGATLAADAGVEVARKYLLDNAGASLENNQSASGYYATSQDALDLTGNRTPGDDSDDVKWPGVSNGIASPFCLADDDAAGNAVCFIVHRLCKSTGTIDVLNCATEIGKPSDERSLGINRQGETYTGNPDPLLGGTTMAYYRVTIRVVGPRNNISFVQAFLLI